MYYKLYTEPYCDLFHLAKFGSGQEHGKLFSGEFKGGLTHRSEKSGFEKFSDLILKTPQKIRIHPKEMLIAELDSWEAKILVEKSFIDWEAKIKKGLQSEEIIFNNEEKLAIILYVDLILPKGFLVNSGTFDKKDYDFFIMTCYELISDHLTEKKIDFNQFRLDNKNYIYADEKFILEYKEKMEELELEKGAEEKGKLEKAIEKKPEKEAIKTTQTIKFKKKILKTKID